MGRKRHNRYDRQSIDSPILHEWQSNAVEEVASTWVSFATRPGCVGVADLGRFESVALGTMAWEITHRPPTLAASV